MQADSTDGDRETKTDKRTYIPLFNRGVPCVPRRYPQIVVSQAICLEALSFTRENENGHSKDNFAVDSVEGSCAPATQESGHHKSMATSNRWRPLCSVNASSGYKPYKWAATALSVWINEPGDLTSSLNLGFFHHSPPSGQLL